MSKNEPKQVIIVRKDLNMRKGKIAAQSAHASMSAILNYASPIYEGEIKINVEKTVVREWITGLHTKVCVSVDSEEELLEIYNKAKDSGLNASIIKDAGLTEFNGVATLTCVAIGPDYPENIDPITKHLKLL